MEIKRKRIAAGNWKMNTTLETGMALAEEIKTNAPYQCRVILAPPFIELKAVHDIIANKKSLHLAAQNCHFAENGAFTGETSVDMLKSVGVEFVIIGHSERRDIFLETDEMLAKKVDAALQGGLKVIFCCGESLSIREQDGQVEFVGNQLKNGLFHISTEQMENVVIAYEPIWAIGTGVTASPEQAQEMHKEIRSMIKNAYNEDVAEATSILYGGSVKPANALDIFAQPDVDGGLVGGAALNADDFIHIIKSF